MPPRNDLESARLQDLPLEAVSEGFRDVLARSSAICDAEYGTRADDGALVFHFFPPGYAADMAVKWPSWEGFRDRLEAAALAYFSPESIDAGYVEELKSFYLILRPPPVVPDRTALIERFFGALEA